MYVGLILWLGLLRKWLINNDMAIFFDIHHFLYVNHIDILLLLIKI